MCVCVCVIGSSSAAVGDDIGYLECLETCQLRQHRHCVQAPDKCGACLSSYTTLSDGDEVCQPVNQQQHTHTGVYHNSAGPTALSN